MSKAFQLNARSFSSTKKVQYPLLGLSCCSFLHGRPGSAVQFDLQYNVNRHLGSLLGYVMPVKTPDVMFFQERQISRPP